MIGALASGIFRSMQTRSSLSFRPVRLSFAALATTALLVSGCGSGNDETDDASATTVMGAASQTDESGSARNEAANDGSTQDSDGSQEDEVSDLDVCSEITGAQVGEILGVTIVNAQPNSAWTTPNCSYAIEMDGFPEGATVANIQWNARPFLAGQREIQEDATEVAGLNDTILITTGSPMLILAGASGDFVVTGGVELSVGGEVATVEQLTAIAKLAQEI